MSFLLLEGGGHLVLEHDAPALTWLDAETVIRQQIEAEWATSDFASMPLAWENSNAEYAARYMVVNIEGHLADKTRIGSAGKRSSVEYGLVYFHAFTPTGTGKREAISAVLTMSGILELRTIAGTVTLEGANPPSPVESRSARDLELPGAGQSGGNYFRCSGSVPFCLIGTR